MKLDREFHIVAGATKVADKRSTAVIYAYERSGRFYAQMFIGKCAKPTHHYSYRSAVERETSVRNFLDSARRIEAQRTAEKAKRAARLAAPHKLQIGHVLCSSWGYDQTNVDFFQVVGLAGKRTVLVRKIGSTMTSGDRHHSGECLPLIDAFTGEATSHRVSEYNSIRVGHSQTATIWSGKPQFCSFYA